MPVFLFGRQLDAGITASGTTFVPIGTPYRKLWLSKVTVHMLTAPIGGAAITLTLQKRSPGILSLSLAQDITATFITNVNTTYVIPLLSTLADTNRTLAEGEVLYASIIAAGTVTTQPVGLTLAAEVLILE